jgi:[NiFe] hydrogenase large subunit
MATPKGNFSGPIVIDPITRIEGHLRIEVEVNEGKVSNAWSSAQLFRGLEIILKGRDPQDAQHFTQRTCGVCTYTHALASTRCVENALEVHIPENATLIRNLVPSISMITLSTSITSTRWTGWTWPQPSMPTRSRPHR